MVFHVEADVETPWKDVGNLYQSCDAFSDRQVHGLGASHSLLEAACTGKDSKSTPARQSLKATNDGAIDMARTTFAECFDSLWVDQYEENLPDLVYDLRTQFRRYKLFKTFLVGLVPTRIPCDEKWKELIVTMFPTFWDIQNRIIDYKHCLYMCLCPECWCPECWCPEFR